MKTIQDAPYLRIADPAIQSAFFSRWSLDSQLARHELIRRVAGAFSHLPYENLTKIIKADALVTPRSAMRYPDEVIGDWLRWGTGGTCFSLTAAVIAIHSSLGIEAHPVLADRHYGPDTHCGLVIVEPPGLLLLDPGYLLFTPAPTPVERAVFVDNGHNRIELRPLAAGRRVELYTIVKNSRKHRLTYKMEPVDAPTFARAWERSFAWEMMTYPVLTRSRAGVHHYLQGNALSTRRGHSTERTTLPANAEARFIKNAFGIDPAIVTKALEIVAHGTAAPARSG